MAEGFFDIARTSSVRAAQEANGVAQHWDSVQGMHEFTRFTGRETEFIAARDHFYMATVSETGWPYVQHRGGPPGFLRVLDDKTLAFADFRGNRQYLSVGNLGADPRASLILVDYPNRRRLKMFVHVEIKNLGADPSLAARLELPGYKAVPERAMVLHLEAFDWNCPQHITPRFTLPEVEEAMAPVRAQIEELIAENRALRDKLAAPAVG